MRIFGAFGIIITCEVLRRSNLRPLRMALKVADGNIPSLVHRNRKAAFVHVTKQVQMASFLTPRGQNRLSQNAEPVRRPDTTGIFSVMQRSESRVA